MSEPRGSGSYDYDWLVIGSGFGGSVSALRLAEKGYSVGVLECGRRFGDKDFPKTTWNLRRYIYAPKLGLKGIFRMTPFRHLFVVSGAGVGGGSLGYANTLYRPTDKFYEDPLWAHLNDDWKAALAPHYDEAERMLGVTEYDFDGPADKLMRELAEELEVADSYHRPRVGVFLGEAGKTVKDPYFGGEGPDRTGCIHCGRCMPGCRYNAKNTLPKNYLWFAERRGVRIMPERMVVDVKPIGAEDGSEGYEVISEQSGAWLRKDRQTLRARGVVVAAGPLGTNKLLQGCKLGGSLPRISDRLGYSVRSNSESIPAVTIQDDSIDFTHSVSISSSIHPDEETHIENFTYGPGADSMNWLWTLWTGRGSRLTRPLKFLATVARHPIQFLRVQWPVKFGRRSMILLVMQNADSQFRLRPKRGPLRRGLPGLGTEQDPEKPIPTYIPVAEWAAKRLAEKLDGIARIGATELFNIPMTAHIMGGAVMGDGPDNGVIDSEHRVFGYENLLVCDGSTIPANLGVNPSLTITAMSELAMSHIPAAAQRESSNGGPPSERSYAQRAS